MSNKPQKFYKHLEPNFLSVFRATEARLARHRIQFLVSVDELYTIWQGLRNAKRLEQVMRTGTGPNTLCQLAARIADTSHVGILEAGVFQGASATFIAEAMKHLGCESELVLADTFAGMPDELIDEKDNWKTGGHKATSVTTVKALVSGSCATNVTCIAGRIPDSLVNYAGPPALAFVHLDLDLHLSTLHALRFSWPRLLPGAWLVCHNYNDKGSVRTEGVRAAFTEFFGSSNDAVSLVEIADTQILAIRNAYC